MPYTPDTPLLLTSVQRAHLRLTITRYITLMIVTLAAGFMALLAIASGISAAQTLNDNTKPFGYILIGAGGLIALILFINWMTALRQRPAQLHIYEKGMTLHTRSGEQFAAFAYTDLRNFSIVKVQPTLYTLLFAVIGGLLAIPLGIFVPVVVAAGAWLDQAGEKAIAEGSDPDIARTQIVILFAGSNMPYTIDTSFDHFPLILHELPSLVAQSGVRIVRAG